MSRTLASAGPVASVDLPKVNREEQVSDKTVSITVTRLPNGPSSDVKTTHTDNPLRIAAKGSQKGDTIVLNGTRFRIDSFVNE